MNKIFLITALSTLPVLAQDGTVFIFGGSRPARTSRWITGASSFSATDTYGQFDMTSDWYIEYVMRLDQTDGNNIIAGPTKELQNRFLRGPIQAKYDSAKDSATKYVYNSDINARRLRWPKSESHHVMFVNVGHVCSLYIDGELMGSSDWTGMAADGNQPKTPSNPNVNFNTHHEVRLMRFGYLGERDPAALVAGRFNRGDPLMYQLGSDTNGVLVSIHEKDMTLEGATNEITGTVLQPAAGTKDKMSYRTDDPYAKVLSGAGAPTTVPRYAGQFYRETETLRLYKAVGNSTPADWKGYVYAEDLAAVKVAKVNGVSLVGSGDLTITASAYHDRVDATECGAVGDGVKDDTAAVLLAVSRAKKEGRAVYLPKTAGGGVYRVTSPIALESRMALVGAPGVRIAGTLSVSGSNIDVSEIAVNELQVANAEVVNLNSVSAGAASITGSRNIRVTSGLYSNATCGLSLMSSEGVLVRGAVFAAGAKGISLGATAVSCIIENCLFDGCTTGVEGAGEAIIADNVFRGVTAAINCSGTAILQRDNLELGE